MRDKKIAAFGLYPDRSSLEAGIQRLKAADFRNQDISVIFDKHSGTGDSSENLDTKLPEGIAAGAGAGAALGGAVGWLVGIGTITIPGLGPFLAAGPIAAALSAAGAGGLLGGITGALVGIGIPEHQASRYEGGIQSGGVFVSVHCEDPTAARAAKEILAQTGAEDVSSSGE